MQAVSLARSSLFLVALTVALGACSANVTTVGTTGGGNAGSGGATASGTGGQGGQGGGGGGSGGVDIQFDAGVIGPDCFETGCAAPLVCCYPPSGPCCEPPGPPACVPPCDPQNPACFEGCVQGQ